MAYQTIFFTSLIFASISIHAMNVQKNYGFAMKEFGSGCCIPQEDYDRELPYLLPGKKHTSFLQESLYDGFINRKIFIAAMTEQELLPLEIINVIITKSCIATHHHRNIKAEKFLQTKYAITYKDLCYLTKAQKQFLLYCTEDAPHNNKILTIEGDDEEFSFTMLERFCSLPSAIQTKLSRHANGNSLYVKTNYTTPPLFNRMLGQDPIARTRNVGKLATIATIATIATMGITTTALAWQTINKDFVSAYVNLIARTRERSSAFSAKGINYLGMSNATASIIGAIVSSLCLVPIITSPYIAFLGAPAVIVATGCIAHKQTFAAFNQTFAEEMHHRGFEEFFVLPKEDAKL